jgi:hypothetical protein
MHDDGITPRFDDATDEFLERSMFGGPKPRCGLTRRLAARQSFTADLRAVDHTYTKFHRHGNTHCGAHGGDAFRDQRWLLHEARAERA